MSNAYEDYPQIIRMDSLTGVGNHVGFFEWLLNPIQKGQFDPFSLMSTEVLGLKELNQASGREAGDRALRWAVNVVKEITKQPTYRMGNELLTIIKSGSPPDQSKLAKQVSEQLNRTAPSAGLAPPAGNVIVINFTAPDQCVPETILSAYYGALFFLKQKPEIHFQTFDAGQMKPVTGFLAYMVYHTVSRNTSIGSTLDLAHQHAYYDPISDLPNMLAAVNEIKEAIKNADAAKEPFSVVIVDGDTLRQYNKLNYSGGDDMIKKLGETLKHEIRPTDFIARWMWGDQFLILLPNTIAKSATNVAERMRAAVERKSKEWMIHSTVSIGISVYPVHGKTPKQLIDAAEAALKRAKDSGKNRVAAA